MKLLDALKVSLFLAWFAFMACAAGMGILMFASLLAGCYADHAAEPCDAGDDYGGEAGPARELRLEPRGTQRSAGNGGGLPRRSPNGWCEGPYVGCIAPGSPVSSTWEGK